MGESDVGGINDKFYKKAIEQGTAYYKLERYAEAVVAFEDAIQLSPESAVAYVGKGDSLRKLQLYQRAIKSYEQALLFDPGNASAYTGMSYAYIKIEDYETALVAHEIAISLDFGNANAYNCGGKIYRLQGRYEEALEAFTKAILLSNGEHNRAGFYYNKGLTLCDLHRYYEALQAYESAIFLEPGKIKYLQERTLLRSKLKLNTRQAHVYELSKTISEYMIEGAYYYNSHHYEEALRCFDCALQIDTTHTPAYVRKAKALLELKLYREASQTFDKATRLQPQHPLAFIGKGDALLALQKYEQALESYDKALELNSHLSQAHAGRGSALYKLCRSMDALKAYTEAIQCDTEDVNCFLNSGEILTGLGGFEEAIKMYEQALRFAPECVAAHVGRAHALFELKQYQEALSAYLQVVALDPENIAAYVSMGDIQLTFQTDAEASRLYSKALKLVRSEQSLDRLWFLVNPTHAPFRPPDIQFELVYQFVMKASHDSTISKALTGIDALYEQLFNSKYLSPDKLQRNVRKLAHILEYLPEERRSEALLLVTGDDDIRTVQILIALESYSIAGLGRLAHGLTIRLKPEPREDDLFMRFHHVLHSYGVSCEDSDWLLCQLLMAQHLPRQAKSVLTNLVKLRPTADVIWLLAQTLEDLNESAQNQVAILHDFINIASPSDERKGLAWKRIGELYEQRLQNGIEAIKAYEQAEQYGCIFQQLWDFRSGHWETIPALHSHPDFAFPPVVVIDLESEYRPDAPLGSTVFEVGAVCAKGATELNRYQAVILRDHAPQKVAHRQHEAKPLKQVVEELCEFIEHSQQSIEKAIIVGHNLQVFDAPHLRAMGVPIKDEQIIDTLNFARFLYPDCIHHNLSLLCHTHGISLEEAHQALPDAQACAHLLHALGNELMERGESLICGFRAFVPPESAFDQAVLQPRNQAACPDYPWHIDPTPAPPHMLETAKEYKPSSQLLEILHTENDALVERFDPQAAYASYLPAFRKTVVTVASRARLEQVIFSARKRSDLFVLPNPHTLLCPDRLRQCIEQEEDQQIKLALFCLYQASHNHDASVLYPLRLPVGPAQQLENGMQGVKNRSEAVLQRLKWTLLDACCIRDWDHSDSCSAMLAAKEAINTAPLLLATHEDFLQRGQYLTGDVIIVDDVDELQMHFAEHLAKQVTSQQILNYSQEMHDRLAASIYTYIREHGHSSAFRERLPLSVIAPYLTQPQDEYGKSVLTMLRDHGDVGEALANMLEDFCRASLEHVTQQGYVHAYWLDLRIAHNQTEPGVVLEQWSFRGLSRDIRQAFREFFWQPFHQHILCGTAIALGAAKTEFLQRFFGLPDGVVFLADKRPPFHVHIPTAETIRPSSLLGRKSWAESAGAFIYRLALSSSQSLVVALHSSAIANAMADAFCRHEKQVQHQIVSPHLGWTTTKIAERFARDGYPALAFISPYMRKIVLKGPVAVEVTGPLRFLNQRDPLVAAQIHAFTSPDNKDGAFTSYLLPQALLELKARMASQADVHIVLDSALRDAMYRDEVFNLFDGNEVLDTLAEVPGDSQIPDELSQTLAEELERQGLSHHFEVNDEDMYLALRTYWHIDRFRTSPLDQKEVVRGVLEGRDQLVIAATGGGKSLCFQLPAILLAQDVVPKVTLIISPLIALMHDQIASLHSRGIFSAVVLDSQLSEGERKHYLQGVKRGDYSIIYIAPEQVHTSALRRALQRREIGFIAIDEAHCVSQWGHHFRTDYFTLNKWIRNAICEGRKRSFPLLALTATARKGYVAPDRSALEKATVEDIIEKLDLHLTAGDVNLTSPERSELEFRVEHLAVSCQSCHHPIRQRLGEGVCENCHQWYSLSKENIRRVKIRTLLRLLNTPGEKGLRNRWEQPLGKRQRGIVYCRTVDETKNVCRDIKNALPELRVEAYNASLTPETRTHVYQRFMSDGENGLDIVVATNAFGMGIDARRLGFVIHFDVPATLEAYYQEAGRAGRDPVFQGDKDHAQCILLYHESDLESQHWLISQGKITEQDIEAVYEALYRCKGSGDQEVLATPSAIKLLSGVEEQKIVTCLFYLENHVLARGLPVLERRENATQLWQLKFEQGYQQHIHNPALSPLSKQLIEVLSSTSDFRLSEEQTTIVDAHELATCLNWAPATVDSEVKNLVRRHILAIASPIYVKWNKNRDESSAIIGQLIEGIRVLLTSVKDRRALLDGKVVAVSLQIAYDGSEQYTVPMSIFSKFLSKLAQVAAGDLQLFDMFKKVENTSWQDCYRLCLKLPVQPSDRGKTSVAAILRNLRQQLCQAIQRFGCEVQADEWRSIDLLKEIPDYRERQQVDQLLQWLASLELLTFAEEAQREVTLRVHFLQDIPSSSNLEIDLTSLRLVEHYAERKLALMREYAISSSAEQRRRLLHTYFLGERPLIEPFAIRSDLTEEQKALVVCSDGYHLIQGPAGSGKTTILEEHFRYLVEHLLVPIDRILVTGHFHSAIDRMGSHLSYLHGTGKFISTKTLQSLSEGIFRHHLQLLTQVDGSLYFSDTKAIRLLTGTWDEKEEKKLMLVSEALETLYKEQWIREHLPSHMDPPLLSGTYRRDALKERRCLEKIIEFQSCGIFPPHISDVEELLTALKRGRRSVPLLQRDLAFYYATYISYQLIQGKQGVYTYEDQILFAIAILKTDPQVAKHWQYRYEHIIIDEFQDLTPAAAELIGLLSQKYHNVLAVGDDRQHILAISAEKDTQEETFELVGNDNSLQVHWLTSNFRSSQEIIDVANALLQPFQENRQIAVRGPRGIRPSIIRVHPGTPCASKNGDGRDEAVLHTMIDAALHYINVLPPEDAGSVALLVARSKLSYHVQSYLKEKGHPFAILGSKHRYQSYQVKRVLTYFRLIQDPTQANEVNRLLQHCVSPYFQANQIQMLKRIAQQCGQMALEAALESNVLQQVDATGEQIASLRKHIAVIQKYELSSTCKDVWQSVKEIQDGSDVHTEEYRQAEEDTKELEEVMDELQEMTVQQALEHIDSSITFLEENRINRKLVVTTIDHAKSQDFDSVFLVGAHLLKDRRRWYVSVTRAKQRSFCLVDAHSDSDIISSLSRYAEGLFDELLWP